MKTTNLSLAILLALGLTACGSTSSKATPDKGNKGNNGGNGQTDPKPDPKPPVDSTVVDPTKTDVVDSFGLNEKSSVGSIAYVRQADSQFNINAENLGKDSAVSVFLGLDLDEQNPSLTNIVLGKITADKIAQFAGSKSQSFDPAVNPLSLQVENAANVEVIFDKQGTVAPTPGYAYLNGMFNKVVDTTANPDTTHTVDADLNTYLALLNDVNARRNELDTASGANVATLAAAYNTALDALYAGAGSTVHSDFESSAKQLGIKFTKSKLSYVDETTGADASGNLTYTAKVSSPMPSINDWMKYTVKMGHQVVDFDDVWAHEADITKTAPLDLGLVAIDYDTTTGVAEIRGAEEMGSPSDKESTPTRIYGHFYLAPEKAAGGALTQTADSVTQALTDESQFLNSYKEAAVWNDGTINRLGAVAQSLDHVQYGRVTAQVDPDSGVDKGLNGKWNMKRVEFSEKGDATSVDYYFARGTGETSLDQMAALPKETLIGYKGHAISWGVDNAYASGNDIPNSWGTSTKRGLGNFVDAQLDMGKQKFRGNIYNAWVTMDNTVTPGVVKDANIEKRNLIQFTGDVHGNSVLGKSRLAYDTSKTGDLRATFYGANANEVGGSVNSTTMGDVYNDAEWGAVFGAKRTTVDVAPVVGKNEWLGDVTQ